MGTKIRIVPGTLDWDLYNQREGMDSELVLVLWERYSYLLVPFVPCYGRHTVMEL